VKRVTISEVRAAVDVVVARLNGDPQDQNDWAVIAMQLRAAAKLAERMTDQIGGAK
jgi:hypothetical protein